MPSRLRLLFAPMIFGRGLGPLFRCMSVASEARKRGHECRFIAKPDFASFLKEHHFPCTICQLPQRLASVRSSCHTWTGQAILSGSCGEKYLAAQIQLERAQLRAFRPHFVFMESNITMPLACRLEEVPFSSTYSLADRNEFQLSRMTLDSAIAPDELHAYNSFLLESGGSVITDISTVVAEFSRLLVSPTIPALNQRFQSESLLYVGHLLFPEIEYRADTQRCFSQDNTCRVYAYLKTSDFSADTWVQTLLGLASRGRSWLQIRAIANVECDIRTDNLLITNTGSGGFLARAADVVIGSGTANTISVALLHAKPQICVPGVDTERLFNSEQVESAGIGTVLMAPNIDELLTCLADTGADTRMRSRVSLLSRELSQYRGPQAVVNRIEQLSGV